MIEVSGKFWDTAFVSKVMRQHKLDPRPVDGFAQEPMASFETEDWTRKIEMYPWGHVLFLSNKKAGQHATVVAVGDLDIDTGEISGADSGSLSDAVAWYRKLAATAAAERGEHDDPDLMKFEEAVEAMEEDDLEEIEADDYDDDIVEEEPVEEEGVPGPGTPGAKSVTAPKPKVKAQPAHPGCVGYHVEERVCDGSYDPKRGKLDPPCTWRERCMALQDFCRTQGKPIEEATSKPDGTPLDHAAIVKLTGELLDRFGPYEPPPSLKASAGKGAEAHAPAGMVEGPPGAGEPAKPQEPPRPVKGKPGGRLDRKAVPGPGEPAKTALKAKREPPPPPKTQITAEEVQTLAEDFWVALLEELGILPADDPDQPNEGECFLTVAEKGGFLTGYRVVDGKEVSFIRLWPKRNLGAIHVQLPFGPDHVVYKGKLEQFVKPRKHGAFRSILQMVDRDAVKFVTERIAGAALDLHIGLPEE